MIVREDGRVDNEDELGVTSMQQTSMSLDIVLLLKILAIY